MNRSIYLLSIIFIVTTACGGGSVNKQSAGCDAPKPQAIFNDKPDEILKHTFSLKGQNAEENLSLRDGTELIIFQSGCEKIAQEFRFTLPSNKNANTVDLALERLMYLANMDAAFMSFANWSQAIEGLREQFSLQNEIEVEPGFFVGLDRINSTDKTLLIIKLFQK